MLWYPIQCIRFSPLSLQCLHNVIHPGFGIRPRSCASCFYLYILPLPRGLLHLYSINICYILHPVYAIGFCYVTRAYLPTAPTVDILPRLPRPHSQSTTSNSTTAMATNDHNDEKPLKGDNAALKPSIEGGAGGQADLEKYPVPSTRESQDKEDPFGDETNSEIKYRTMEWW